MDKYKIIQIKGTGKIVSVILLGDRIPTFCDIKYELNEVEFTKDEVIALGWLIEEV